MPSQRGRRYRSFCSGVPQCSSVCWLPSSGACALMTYGPMPTLAASADTAAIAVGPSPMPPHSAGMWGSQTPQSSLAIRRSLTIALTTSLRWPWSVASHSGRTTSSIRRRTLRRISSTSGGNEKSIMGRSLASGPGTRADSPPVTTGTGPPAAWDRESLLEGEEKVQAVRQMFDAIAPRYDLVNRLMTFRLDVRWRRLAVRSLDLAPGSVVADLASGTGDLCVELGRQGLRPLSVDLSFGMLHADRSRAPRAQADILRLPFPQAALDGVTCGFALRNLMELGPFFDELARDGPPRGPHRAPGRRHAAQPHPPPWSRLLLRPGGPPDRRAALGSCGLSLPAQERGVPSTAGGDAGAAAPCGVHHRAASPPVGRDHPARHRDRERRRDEGRHPAARPVTSTSTASPAATATCSCGTGSGSRRGASRPASPCRGAGRAGRHRARRRRRPPRLRPGRPRRPAVPARRGGRASSCPRSTIGKGADGARWITTVDGAEADLVPPEPPGPERGQRSRSAPSSPWRRTAPRCWPGATRSGPGA